MKNEPNDIIPGWSRWAKNVSFIASSLNVLTPSFLDGLRGPHHKGTVPEDRILRAGRWLLVEWRRRTEYKFAAADIPDFVRAI